MKARVGMLLACVAMATGCPKKQDDETSRSPGSARGGPAAPSAQGGASDGADSVGPDVDLPEDFAEDAKREVTAATVAEQLRNIEKELENSDQ